MADLFGSSIEYSKDLLLEPWETPESQLIYDPKYPIAISNSLIKGAQPMSIREQKIFMLMVSQIQPDDNEFKPFQIPVNTLADILQVKSLSSLRRDLPTLAADLLSHPMLIKIEKPGTKEGYAWKMFNLMEASEFDGTYFRLKLSSSLLPYLTNLQGDFTTLSFPTMCNFTSSYAVRIYQMLLMSYKKHYKKVRNFKVSLEALKMALKDTSDLKSAGKIQDFVKKDSYSRYYNFKQRVLAIAEKQINENLLTEFTIRYEEIKEGHKVAYLNFILTPREYYEDLTKATPEELKALKEAQKVEYTIKKSNEKVSMMQIDPASSVVVDASEFIESEKNIVDSKLHLETKDDLFENPEVEIEDNYDELQQFVKKIESDDNINSNSPDVQIFEANEENNIENDGQLSFLSEE